MKQLNWRDAKERKEYIEAWPQSVRDKFNDCLRPVQQGHKPLSLNTCKPWTGIPNCHELSSQSYRLIFVWSLPNYIYVLHAFGGKDSSKGKKTRKKHTDTVERRWAELQAELNKASGNKQH